MTWRPLPIVALLAALGIPARGAVVIDQPLAAACGKSSLYIAAKLKSAKVDWPTVDKLLGDGKAGAHSFAELAGAARRLGLHPIGLEVDRRRLLTLPAPAILHFQLGRAGEDRPHFAVGVAWGPDGVTMLDAPYPAQLISWERIESLWTGNVLLLGESEAGAQQIAASLDRPDGAAVWGALAGGAAGVALVGIWWRMRRGVAAPSRLSTKARAISHYAGQAFGPRRRHFAAAACLCGACGLAAAAYLWFAPRPALALAKRVNDFGELPPGEREERVPIRNAGNSELRIERVESSCTCAVANWPKTIAPGETADLRVQLRVSAGSQVAEVRLVSNDPAGTKTAVLRWFSPEKPGLSPPRIGATGLPAGRPYVRTVNVVYPGGLSAVSPQFVGCRCSDPSVEVRDAGVVNPVAFRAAGNRALPGVAVGSRELAVTVTPKPGVRRVNATCDVTVRYGSSESVLWLPVQCEFSGGTLRADREQVTFAAPDLAQLVGQRQEIRLRSDAPPAGLSIADCPPWLKCSVGKRAGGGAALSLEIVDRPPRLLEHVRLSVSAADTGLSPLHLDVDAFALR